MPHLNIFTTVFSFCNLSPPDEHKVSLTVVTAGWESAFGPQDLNEVSYPAMSLLGEEGGSTH